MNYVTLAAAEAQVADTLTTETNTAEETLNTAISGDNTTDAETVAADESTTTSDEGADEIATQQQLGAEEVTTAGLLAAAGGKMGEKWDAARFDSFAKKFATLANDQTVWSKNSRAVKSSKMGRGFSRL